MMSNYLTESNLFPSKLPKLWSLMVELLHGGKKGGGLRILVSGVKPFFTTNTVFIPQLRCRSK